MGFSDNSDNVVDRAVSGVIERDDVGESVCEVESEEDQIGEQEMEVPVSYGTGEDRRDPLEQLLQCAEYRLQDGLAGV